MEPLRREDRRELRADRRLRYDATSLRGKRIRLIDDLPTSDAGHVQEALVGITEVICLDDTPSVTHDLCVHPSGSAGAVAGGGISVALCDQ